MTKTGFVVLFAMHCGTEATTTGDASTDAASDSSDASSCMRDAAFFECPALCPAHYQEGTPCSTNGLVCQGGDPTPPCNIAPIHCTCNGTSFHCIVDCFPSDAGAD
jgi:hypothetical protein